MSVNQYDHEDAFRDANIFAGSKVAVADSLRVCPDKFTAQKILEQLQEQHSNLFDAFIAGVDYGRRHPKKGKETND